jgi:hypothetical protein
MALGYLSPPTSPSCRDERTAVNARRPAEPSRYPQ